LICSVGHCAIGVIALWGNHAEGFVLFSLAHRVSAWNAGYAHIICAVSRVAELWQLEPGFVSIRFSLLRTSTTGSSFTQIANMGLSDECRINRHREWNSCHRGILSAKIAAGESLNQFEDFGRPAGCGPRRFKT
jgi:hypothetical protein